MRTARTSALVVGAVLVALALAGACAKDEPPAPPKPVTVTRSDSVRPLCSEDGRWNQCVLLDRLVHAGVAPLADSTDTTHVAFLKPPGVHYKIGKSAELVVFYYPDSVQALKAWNALDTLRLAPSADTVRPWPRQPIPIRAANAIAVLFSEKLEQIERVRAVFAAGLPAPR